MSKWWQFGQRLKQKQTDISSIRTMIMRGTAVWSAFDFVAFVDEGFKRNATVRACIDAKARAAAGLPIVLTDASGKVIANHPVLDWIKRPNSAQKWDQFVRESVSNYHLAGEADWLRIGISRKTEVLSLRPDWLSIESYDDGGLPERYRYNNSAQGQIGSAVYGADEVRLWADYNPLDRWRGLSVLHSCAFAIDTLNSYAASNKATLDNGVTPSGVLSTAQQMTDDSFARLKSEFNEAYAGSRNSGKPMVLESGLGWTQTGLSPREMEYINGKRENELDVCRAMRVPPQMIGIQGSMTFANYEQARAAFYEDEVIPLANSLLSSLLHLIGQAFGVPDGYMLTVDVDSVAALEPRRAERMATIDKLQSITTNEKRAEMGWAAVVDGDAVLVSAGLVPLDMVGIEPTQMTGL